MRPMVYNGFFPLKMFLCRRCFFRKSLAIGFFAVFLGTGCSTVAEDFARQAKLLNLEREVMRGSNFQHVVYRKSGNSSATLHVYIDGDGTPWIAGRPTDDPTPRNALLLKLMSLDPASSAYVGRPCYHGMHSTDACASRFWLSHRYGEAVVVSLAEVIKHLLRSGRYRRIALIGHSGGGTLAVLLASRLPETVAVVTVAANLDLSAWAAYTENDDLNASLNPAELPALDPSIKQYHFAGGKDDIVPPALMVNAAKQLGSNLIVIDDYDHVCCWERLWANILDDVGE
ncbi:alpha/beta hydrolase family protein [Methylomonas methanica]|uniref:Alpha/beta hydrolase n=1 Tax=Methylomonas methanica (strain DSM 25384 / MC09) TaxID=857087 RepID=F9ZY93_METMM|nr:alpha/beta hydrolase-fold protein [Methylomonas methanica]AEG00998.1 hypothetical protein Metme_2608 [Methylomonas methanica MC09]